MDSGGHGHSEPAHRLRSALKFQIKGRLWGLALRNEVSRICLKR